MLSVPAYDESNSGLMMPVDDGLMVPDDIDLGLSLPANRLVARYREILQMLDDDRLDFADSGRPHYSNHLAEDASDAQEWQSRAAVTQHLTDELRSVEHAYTLLQLGRYGQCEHCGHAIPPRRLAIIPSATLCVPCQERADQRAAGH